MNQIEQKVERDADSVTRDLESLVDRHAFKEVRLIMQHIADYMGETIEALEEYEEQPSGFRASVHRHSA
jgi:hypothetical protein